MDEETIYSRWDVPAVVNASGTKTRIGGSRIHPDAVEAMSEAASAFVRLSDLQAAASERIAEVTGAEAGYVTNGASSALLLAAAACLAGEDPGRMDRLPETDEGPDEIIIPRTHRTGYDHALRAAGASLIEIGTNDAHLGTGARNIEPWEYREAIGEETVAIAHLYKAYTTPPLATVCEIAHEFDLPVIVDAAAEVPPAENLRWFTEQGADLVAFSGGKGIRGPQTTGILAGREALIASVGLQHLDMHAAEAVWTPPELFDPGALDGVPRQGIGRSMKVGKEELVGLLVALDRFLETDAEERSAAWERRIQEVRDRLDGIEGLDLQLERGAKSVAPVLALSCASDGQAPTAVQLARALRGEDPRVFLGADGAEDGRLTINPMCLTDREAAYVADSVRAQFEEMRSDD